MSEPISGMNGSITGLTGATEVTKWTVEVTQEALDATSMYTSGAVPVKRIGCVSGAKATWTSIGDWVDFGTPFTAVFTNDNFSITADSDGFIVTKVDIDIDVENSVVTFNGEGVFNGEPTITGLTDEA